MFKFQALKPDAFKQGFDLHHPTRWYARRSASAAQTDMHTANTPNIIKKALALAETLSLTSSTTRRLKIPIKGHRMANHGE